MSELESNIITALPFIKVSGSGYYQLKCPMCNSKEVKAGFKFESEKIIYSCFKGRCDASTEYVYGNPMYKKFREVMDALGVDVPLDNRLSNNKSSSIKKTTLDSTLYEQHSYTSVALLDGIEEFDEVVHTKFKTLLDDRRVSMRDNLLVGVSGEWDGFLIVPFFYNRMMIGWQGITPSGFYRTYTGDNTDIMYINTPDGVLPKNPLIVEGVFDALMIKGGIAVLGNKVSKKQSYIIRNTTPLLLPDRSGSKFIENIKAQKTWRMTIPEWNEKDLNESIIHSGLFVSAKKIHDGICDTLTETEIKYKLWKK